METDQDKHDSHTINLQKQLILFSVRIQISSHTSDESDILLDLYSHLNQLQRVAASGDMAKKLSAFSKELESNESSAACFLTQFVQYVQSTLELEKNLDTIKEIINCLLPCVQSAMKSMLGKQALKKIICEDLLLDLYKCLVNTFKRESQYQNGATTNLLEYQSNLNKIVKAHIIRMNSEDSKKLFQETFGDCGNTSELYLIYVWQIYMIYEVKERDSMPPSLHCITDVMERSGEYVVVVPPRDMKRMALTNPASPAGRYSSTLTERDKLAAPHPIPDLAFEWTDLWISVLYPNGVVFLVNSVSWEDRLQEISTTIEGLEVKKPLTFMPSLGSTFGLSVKDSTSLHKKIKDVNFIRVRVTRVIQDFCQVYGVDSGSFHWCSHSKLLFLPACIINQPPCGRLARLPVRPAPSVSSLTPIVALLAALAQQIDQKLNFHSKDIEQMSLWLQVTEIELPTLSLMKALMGSPAMDNFLSNIAFVAADHLLRLTELNQLNKEDTPLLISILTLAIQKSAKISLMLVRRGLFITLCEAALTGRCGEAWKCLKALFDQRPKRECLQVHYKAVTHPPALVRNREKHQPRPTTPPDDCESISAVMQRAKVTTSYHHWDITSPPAVTSPQFAKYHSSGNWHWDEDEVMPSHTAILERGHHLGVKTDLTHHIIQERNVSSICSETLLKVILGMLNTHLGGKIYIGLSQSGMVQGVKITRDQQDSLMLGFTKLVRSDISPSLLPCDSHVQFVPVVQPGETPPSAFACYLVILTVKPEPHQVYFSQEYPEKLYLREGGVTLPLHGSRRAQLLSDYQICTQELEKQVTKEKQSLLKLAQS